MKLIPKALTYATAYIEQNPHNQDYLVTINLGYSRAVSVDLIFF